MSIPAGAIRHVGDVDLPAGCLTIWKFADARHFYGSIEWRSGRSSRVWRHLTQAEILHEPHLWGDSKPGDAVERFYTAQQVKDRAREMRQPPAEMTPRPPYTTLNRSAAACVTAQAKALHGLSCMDRLQAKLDAALEAADGEEAVVLLRAAVAEFNQEMKPGEPTG